MRITALIALLFCGSHLLAQKKPAVAKSPRNSVSKPITEQAILPKVIHTRPAVSGFFEKLIYFDSIPIRSAAVVDDKALQVAYGKLHIMLAHMPVAKHNMAQWGVELHIIGKDQQTSDLPEYRDRKGISYVDNMGVTTNIDDRTRGMGGLYTSCGEENLLHLPTDRYAGGSDICMHEFAHAIMAFGLDDVIGAAIVKQYQNATAKGLWKDAYAAVNAQEYWAELSMWYFGAHGQFIKGTKLPEAGIEGLKNYDPEGYALLHSIYSGQVVPQSITLTNAQMVSANTFSGLSTDAAYIKFSNDTSEKLKLFWVDPDGKQQPYGDIQAYNFALQPTFTSHVWMVKDGNDKIVNCYRVGKPFVKAQIKARK